MEQSSEIIRALDNVLARYPAMTTIEAMKRKAGTMTREQIIAAINARDILAKNE